MVLICTIASSEAIDLMHIEQFSHKQPLFYEGLCVNIDLRRIKIGHLSFMRRLST